MTELDWQPVLRFARPADGFWERKIADRDQRKAVFSSYSETVPTHPEVVFYESMSGARMMDSPYAIFEALTRDPSRRAPLLHVWSVHSMDVVPPELRERQDTIFVSRHTRAYMYLLTRAKYIIGNSALPEYFVRKQDQFYLNTWHGVGYKSLGRSERSPLGAALAVSNMLQSTHVLSPCAFMTRVHQHGFSMRGTYTGQLAETGYPRLDTTLAVDERKIANLRSELGLDPTKSTILYAPTWRGARGDSGFDTERLESDLRQLVHLGLNVIFLGHHIMNRHISSLDVPGVALPAKYMNTNQLLAVADLLITDYSSIFFDFMITKRPIVHYLYDYHSYKRDRGLALSRAALPGKIEYTSDDLIATVNDILSRPEYAPDDRYLGAMARFCPYDDGNATERVIEWFFYGDVAKVKLIPSSSKKRVCFWGGRMSEIDESSQFLERLRRRAEQGDADVTLFVAHGAARNQALRDLLVDIGDRISVVARADYAFGMTLEEKRARDELSSESLPETRALYHRIYQREYRRLFGDTRFDEVIILDGLSVFWRELAKYAHK